MRSGGLNLKIYSLWTKLKVLIGSTSQSIYDDGLGFLISNSLQSNILLKYSKNGLLEKWNLKNHVIWNTSITFISINISKTHIT